MHFSKRRQHRPIKRADQQLDISRYAPEGVEVRVIAQATLDVLVEDVQHVVPQYRWVVGLHPYLVIDFVHLHLPFLRGTLFLLLPSLDLGNHLARTRGSGDGGNGKART